MINVHGSGNGFRHGLSFLATIAFVSSLIGSRTFATLNPQIVVIQQGIHFHHFWYGLALIAIAGWLGIARPSERLSRVYATVYGLGAGFIGDEVGLLLTFGDYYSELTYISLVAAVSFILLAMLLLRYGDRVVRDVFSISSAEKVFHLGIFLVGFSAIFFAFGLNLQGVVVALAGLIVAAVGEWRERRPASTDK